MAKKSVIPALPTPSRGAVMRRQADHMNFALLEFQSPTAALIAEPAPFMARVSSYVIATTILAAVVAMFIIKVDMVVTASAVTQSSEPDIIVQPLQTGMVMSINVKEGQAVKKGQLLARLDPTMTTATSTATTAQNLSLRAQVDRLKAEMADREYISDGTPYSNTEAQAWRERHANFTSQSDSLKEKIQAARYKVEQFKADQLGFSTQLPLLQSVEDKRRELARQGLDSQLDLLAAINARVQVQAQLADMTQQLTGAQHDLQGAIADYAAFVHNWYEQTSTTLGTQERALSDMNGQATSNAFLSKVVELRAPQDSVVYNISTVAIGSVLQTGVEIMRLVPTNAALEVVGFEQGSDAGFMKAGDTCAIKFDTLPFVLFGFATGHVNTVSADSFQNVPPPQQNALPQQPTLGVSQPQALPAVSPVLYKVNASITDMSGLHNVPPSFKVMPGMPVTMDIHVGQRTVLQYFFQRVVPTFTEGMREP